MDNEKPTTPPQPVLGEEAKPRVKVTGWAVVLIALAAIVLYILA